MKTCPNHIDLLLAKLGKMCNHFDLWLAKVEKMCESSRFIAGKNKKIRIIWIYCQQNSRQHMCKSFRFIASKRRKNVQIISIYRQQKLAEMFCVLQNPYKKGSAAWCIRDEGIYEDDF